MLASPGSPSWRLTRVVALAALVTTLTWLTLPIELSSVQWKYPQPLFSRQNEKIALLIEDRPLELIAPLLLHMIAVVPSDWKFIFLGSNASIASTSLSGALRHHVQRGRLHFEAIPSPGVASEELFNRFMTSDWLYNTLLKNAEWLFMFQTESILCSNSESDLNDWLSFDWIGAGCTSDSITAGNGGMSMRHVPAMRNIVEQNKRDPEGQSEDAWFCEKLLENHANLADSYSSMRFATENIYSEKPFSFHVGNSEARMLSHIGDGEATEDDIFGYCPEVKLILDVDPSLQKKGSRYPPKYFSESKFPGHLDSRFSSSHQLSRQAIKEGMSELIQSYVAVMTEIKLTTWIAHGTLLGWFWNQKPFPWNTNLDFQVYFDDLAMLASKYNESYHNHDDKEYLLEINPNYPERQGAKDPNNNIDARWIDTATGLFIDITAVSEASETDSALVAPWFAKAGHLYAQHKLHPLRQSKFDGIEVMVPNDVQTILAYEYGEDSMIRKTFSGFEFDDELLEWIPITSKKYVGPPGGNEP